MTTEMHDDLAARLRAVSERVRAAESSLGEVQTERHALMREALAAGMTAYRVAQVCGVTARAVHKVRDAS